MKHTDKNGTELQPGDVCTYLGDPWDLTIEVPDDYEGDPCTIRSLGPSQIVARVNFEGDPETFKVNTSSLRFHHRPKAKTDKATDDKPAPDDEQE